MFAVYLCMIARGIYPCYTVFTWGRKIYIAGGSLNKVDAVDPYLIGDAWLSMNSTHLHCIAQAW
jgi:hypothetical protein